MRISHASLILPLSFPARRFIKCGMTSHRRLLLPFVVLLGSHAGTALAEDFSFDKLRESARALASLPQLCELASPHLSDSGVCIFPKGERAETEVALARQAWHFDLESSQSITDDKASLLILKGLHCV